MPCCTARRVRARSPSVSPDVTAAIEGIALSKSFGGVKALRSASFAADGGEVHALVGENGAGKSTLIKLLSGKGKDVDILLYIVAAALIVRYIWLGG